MRPVTGNIALKLLSLAVAVGLWLYVTGRTGGTLSVAFPVILDGLPSGLVVTTPPPQSVQGTLKGPRLVLSRLAKRPGVVKLNLRGVTTGEITFSRIDTLVSLPRGVELIRVQPSSITLHIARQVPGS